MYVYKKGRYLILYSEMYMRKTKPSEWEWTQPKIAAQTLTEENKPRNNVECDGDSGVFDFFHIKWLCYYIKANNKPQKAVNQLSWLINDNRGEKFYSVGF